MENKAKLCCFSVAIEHSLDRLPRKFYIFIYRLPHVRVEQKCFWFNFASSLSPARHVRGALSCPIEDLVSFFVSGCVVDVDNNINFARRNRFSVPFFEKYLSRESKKVYRKNRQSFCAVDVTRWQRHCTLFKTATSRRSNVVRIFLVSKV